MAAKLVVTIIGSPRTHSTSAVLARRITSRLEENGWVSAAYAIQELDRRPEIYDNLIKALHAAEIVILASPVYVGALPGAVVRFLEYIVDATVEFSKPPGFLGIANCGFYEDYENDNALAVMKRFADTAGLRWMGGFGIGCGGMIGGKPLEKVRGTEHIRTGLDRAADALVKCSDPPIEAFEEVREPPMPKWMYVKMANLGMMSGGATHGRAFSLNARPLTQPEASDGSRPRSALLIAAVADDDRVLQMALETACHRLKDMEWNVSRLDLADMTIRPCIGCFGCWLRRPGVCLTADDSRAIAAGTISSDLVVMVSPLAFGSYASEMKIAVDHLIPLISPYFELIDGEMHHRKRYPNYPSMMAIGRQSQRDVEEEVLFRRIVNHNAVNLHSPTSSALVFTSQTTSNMVEAAVSAEIKKMVAVI